MSDKNMADVADKALDKLSGPLGELSDAVKRVAPQVWEMMVRQQKIEALTDVGVFACLCLVVLCAHRYARRFYGQTETRYGVESATEAALFAKVGVIVATGAMLVVGAILIPQSARQYFCADYYAAMQLLQVAK